MIWRNGVSSPWSRRRPATLGTWQHTLRAMADDLAVLAAETAENLSNSFPDVNAQDVAALVTDEVAE